MRCRDQAMRCVRCTRALRVVVNARREWIPPLSCQLPLVPTAAVSDTMDSAVACVAGTCDGLLTPRQVIDFHGKIVVCLHEMFYGGTLACADVEAVLRSAKMKAPS